MTSRPFGTQSLVNYICIRRELITSSHLKYACGFIYAVFGATALVFTVVALRNWPFYVAIFDPLVCVAGFYMLFFGTSDTARGVAAMGSLLTAVAWTVALFSQPLLTLGIAPNAHWIIMIFFGVHTNTKRHYSLQTTNVNTYVSVSGAARIVYIVTSNVLYFDGIARSIIIGSTCLAVLYIVQFK